MSNEDKLAALKTMISDPGTPYTDELLSVYLDVAGRKVLRRLYPFRNDVTEVPEEYEYNQLEIAAYLVIKRGAEGETAHSENGISRAWEDADVAQGLLREITPMAEVV